MRFFAYFAPANWPMGISLLSLSLVTFTNFPLVFETFPAFFSSFGYKKYSFQILHRSKPSSLVRCLHEKTLYCAI